MTPTRSLRIFTTGLVLACGFLVGTAAAYIDPGTGSYILQVAIALLVGVAFSVKVFWKKISAFLRKTFSKKKEGGGDAS